MKDWEIGLAALLILVGESISQWLRRIFRRGGASGRTPVVGGSPDRLRAGFPRRG